MLSAASDAYVPARYFGRLSIVRASATKHKPGVMDNDRCLGWGPFAALGVEVVDLDCKHESMLEAEFAPALGRHLDYLSATAASCGTYGR